MVARGGVAGRFLRRGAVSLAARRARRTRGRQLLPNQDAAADTPSPGPNTPATSAARRPPPRRPPPPPATSATATAITSRLCRQRRRSPPPRRPPPPPRRSHCRIAVFGDTGTPKWSRGDVLRAVSCASGLIPSPRRRTRRTRRTRGRQILPNRDAAADTPSPELDTPHHHAVHGAPPRRTRRRMSSSNRPCSPNSSLGPRTRSEGYPFAVRAPRIRRMVGRSSPAACIEAGANSVSPAPAIGNFAFTALTSSSSDAAVRPNGSG